VRPVLIAGPTASGKSALALALAARDGGWVINADAMQVYGCWRVLSARPDAEDLARAPHRLYGHVSCATSYSVGHWLRDLAPVLAAARADGVRPIIVGGTGLYFTALTEGLADIPPTPPALRRASEARLAAGDLAVLVAELEAGDPETHAEIDRRNPRRVQRAWEVLKATGRGLSAWRRDGAPPLVAPAAAERVLLWPETVMLNSHIEQRFHAMLEAGALDEIAAFRAAFGDLGQPSGRVLGAAELARHLDGELTREAATERAVVATRRYAKRQRTWFRARMAAWRRLDPANPCILDEIPRH